MEIERIAQPNTRSSNTLDFKTTVISLLLIIGALNIGFQTLNYVLLQHNRKEIDIIRYEQMRRTDKVYNKGLTAEEILEIVNGYLKENNFKEFLRDDK